MCSKASADFTARAAIRDAALQLFADRGEDAVSLRQVAAQAHVSAGLVVHHFGSKAGLREAVVEHVRMQFEQAMQGAGSAESVTQLRGGQSASLVEVFTQSFPDGSPVLRYLRRLFLQGDPVATQLLASWHKAAVGQMAEWEAQGLMKSGSDASMRMAILMSHDLGMMLLREHWASVLGTDPLGAGVQRWVNEAMAVFAAVGPTSTPEQHPTEEKHD